MAPEHAQGDGDGAALGGQPPLVEGHGLDLGRLAVVQADVDGAGRLPLQGVGAGHAGDAQADVGAGHLAGGAGHVRRHLGAHHPVGLDEAPLHAQGDLHRGVVGHVAGAEVGRGAGHVGDGVGQQAAGAGLHGGQAQSSLLEQAPHHQLQGLVVGAPDVFAQDGPHPLLHGGDEGAGRFLVGRLGPDAHVHAVGTGVDADGGVPGAGQLPQHLVQVTFADADGLEGAGDQHRPPRPLAQARGHLLVPHALHLRRGAGHGDDDAPLLLDPPAGGGAAGVGDGAGGGDEPGLLQVALREGDAAGGEEGPQLLLQCRVHARLLPQDGSDGLPRQIVVGGAQAAGGDDQVGAPVGAADDLLQPL